MLVNRASESSPSFMRGRNSLIGKTSATTRLADISLVAFFGATTSTTKRAPSVDAVVTLTSGIRDSLSARHDRIGGSALMSPASRSSTTTSVLLVSPADAPDMRQVSGASAVAAATPNRLMDSISVPRYSPRSADSTAVYVVLFPSAVAFHGTWIAALECASRGAAGGPMTVRAVSRSLRVSVAHFLNDSVSLVCTAHPITTQKPTMLGDWRK